MILYVDGHEAHRWKVAKSSAVVRLTRDASRCTCRATRWVVVRVDGDEPMAPVVGDRKRFDVRPLALTNPVFLDVDGNGKYDPPEKHGPHEHVRGPRRSDTEWNRSSTFRNGRSIHASRCAADPIAGSLGPPFAVTSSHGTSGAQELYDRKTR